MPIDKLTERVAIVTGGASGIGGEIARTLAADQLQENIVLELKDCIQRDPDLKPFFDSPGFTQPGRE